MTQAPTAPTTRKHAATLTAYHADHEEFDKKPLKLSVILRLFQFTRPHAARRNWLLLLVVIRAIQLPALSYVVSKILTGPIKHMDWQGIIWGTIGFAALFLSTELIFHFRMRLALQMGESVIRDLRQQIFDHLQKMSMRFYDRTKVGRIISRMTSDAEALRMGIQDVFFITMVGGGRMLFAAAVMLWADPPLFCVVLAMAPVIWVVNRFYWTRLSTAYRERQESFSRVTATLAESISGIRITQGFVRQDLNSELFHDLVYDHGWYNIRAFRLTSVLLPFLELNSQFFIAVIILLGGYQVLYGGFFADTDTAAQFEAVVLFFFMMRHFFEPISDLGRQYNAALSAMASAERVFAVLDTEPEQLDDPSAVDVTAITGRVEFQDVCFAYNPEKQVLNKISFIAQPGRTIALVGQTGSGKSTIINLIAKFYLPTDGRILIDDYDIRKITSRSHAQQLGIVLQQNFLFSGTVMDNIRVGRGSATDEEVIEAAKKLHCYDIFRNMPDGFYTDVGERGCNLSLGQRQLVCFTRAMLADPRILILDEATSSVDTMTEARIQEALSLLLKDRTSFVVAHRLSTIRHADSVLVIHEGNIIERGTHNELLQAKGVYANLYRQFIHASEA